MCRSSFNFKAKTLFYASKDHIFNIFHSFIVKYLITFSGGVDYDDNIVYCTFPAGNVPTPLVNNRVIIYEDTVDEDRQIFFVLLQVESATHQNRVKLATSITRCNIDDNDGENFNFFHFTPNFSNFTLLCLKE